MKKECYTCVWAEPSKIGFFQKVFKCMHSKAYECEKHKYWVSRLEVKQIEQKGW